jgi:hypothetical protein
LATDVRLAPVGQKGDRQRKVAVSGPFWLHKAPSLIVPDRSVK